MIPTAQLQAWRDRHERIRVRLDSDDLPWLVRHFGDLLDEVERLRPRQPLLLHAPANAHVGH